MRRGIPPAAAILLAACSGTAPDADRDPPTRIDAAAIVRAYAQDADEADVAFAGHPLMISGDVVRADRTGRHLLLTTGPASERLPASVAPAPHPVAPHDLVTLRCERVRRGAGGPAASGCAFVAIIPARIAHGG